MFRTCDTNSSTESTLTLARRKGEETKARTMRNWLGMFLPPYVEEHDTPAGLGSQARDDARASPEPLRDGRKTQVAKGGIATKHVARQGHQLDAVILDLRMGGGHKWSHPTQAILLEPGACRPGG